MHTVPDNSNVLVFGGSGQLGTALLGRLRAAGTPVLAPPRSEIDLLRADPGPVLEARRPSAVLNATAYNDVGGAESGSGREAAFRLNRDVPAGLSRACAAQGIPFVHVSTDYVFDGRKTTPYLEADPAAPLQTYGRSKLEGERAVLEGNPSSLVVRTSTVYGRGSRDGTNYVDSVLAQARRSETLELVRLPVSSPTLAADLARGILELLALRASGIVHLVNRGACSRLELAQEAIRLAGLSERVRIEERPPSKGGPQRPDYSVLDTARFTEITGKPPRDWQAALTDYLK